jgi:cytochrome b6-f complex iron-sulfur subunit
MSPLEKIRAAAAAKAAAGGAAPAGGSGSEAKQSGESGEPSKPLSPLEKIRAQAAAKAAAGGGAGESGEPSKALSPLEKIRAQAAKKTEAGDPASATPKGESPAAKPAEVKEKPKPLPPKPAKPKAAEATSGTRRFFLLTWVGVAWAAFIAGCSQAILGAVRFLYPNVLQEPPTLFKIGAPDKFEEGNVYEQWKNEYGVWIVKNNGELFAIRTVCTHLGCTPNWLEGEQKFKCPCHGSGFRKTGINFEGPAPRPLERHIIRLADDGQVEIDKSRKLQKELGQWTKENGAFITV